MNELEELKARLARVEELIFRNDAKYGKKSSENNSAVSEVRNKTDTLQIDMTAVGLTIDELIISQADIMTEFITHILLIESEV